MVVVLEDCDLENLKEGKMVKVEIGEDKVIGFVTKKFLEGDGLMDTESMIKAANQLAEAFRQFGMTLKEVIDGIADAFACLTKSEKEKKEKGTSPKKYGMSLISCGKKIRPYTYLYIPIVRRNLPYQRRRF